MRATRGVALILTLLAALALLVIVVAVVGTFSISNRRIAGNTSLELKAQYAAESGAEQSRAVLAEFSDLLSSTHVDLSAGEPAVDHFASQLAAFCYGDANLSDEVRQNIKDAIRGNNSFSCSVKAIRLRNDLADENLSDADLGERWMPFFYNYIERSVYEAKGIVDSTDSPAVYEEKVNRYWGQVLRGTQSNLQRIVEASTGQTTRYRIASDDNAGFVPTRLEIENGEVQLTFGSLSGKAQILSVGEVISATGDVLAKRVVQLGDEGESGLELVIRAPSYAWYAFFFDRQPSLQPEKMIVFTDQTVIDGPVHANDYLAFEQGARPWFGGPVSSAGPATRGGGIRAYWRDSLNGSGGYETPPEEIDGEHWWDLANANPEFAIATNTLGEPLCYNPDTREEEVCENIDADHDGQPDPPWEFKRDVHWDHAEIELPGTDAVASLRSQAQSGGIYIDGSEFCWAPHKKRVKHGDPAPDQCVNKYLRGEGRGRIRLEANGDEQLIRIDLVKVTGWEFKKTEPAHWWKWRKITCDYPPDDGGGDDDDDDGNDGGGGGGVDRLAPIYRWLASRLAPRFSLALVPGATLAKGKRWDEDPSGEACEGLDLPPCDEHCTCEDPICIIAKDVYQRQTENEHIVLRYTKDDPHLSVLEQHGTMDALSYATGPFNGIIVVDANDFYLTGPEKAKPTDPPPAAIAEFAQITVASSKDIRITGDLAYAKPACNKTPHRDINDEDGDGDTDEVVGRCTKEDYQDAAANLLGVYARDIYLYPRGVWKKTGADLTVHAVLMAYEGKVETWNVKYCSQKEFGRFKLLGGMIQKQIGALNWRRKCNGQERFIGYRSALTYDRRMLEGLAPPGFPHFIEGAWNAELSEARTGAPGFWRQVPEN